MRTGQNGIIVDLIRRRVGREQNVPPDEARLCEKSGENGCSVFFVAGARMSACRRVIIFKFENNRKSSISSDNGTLRRPLQR